MNKLTKLLLLFLISFVFQSCNDDDLDSITAPNIVDESAIKDAVFASENFGEATTANFVGVVRDRNFNTLPNTQISIGSSYVVTDRNGVFIVNDAQVFKNFAHIKASKEGYFEGSRVVIPKINGVNRVEIYLKEKNNAITIISGAPSEASTYGVKVNFGGGFINSDGSPYNGEVLVYLDYLRPNNFNSFRYMPGSLFAQTNDNEARSLETYGMASVELFSPSGDELNIDSNSPATIEFRVDSQQQDIAPETINLWYFDEEVGYWKEDGVAIKNDDKYIAEVTHFTWWNCDLPLDFVNLCFSLSLIDTDVSTVYYTTINRVSNDQLIFSGQVNSNDGFECGLIPENEEVKISIYGVAGDCFGELIHEQVLGPYSSDSTIDVMFNEGDLQTTEITGTITNCLGVPLTTGYVFIDGFNVLSIIDGMLNIGLNHCTTETIILQIFDFDSGQWTIVNNLTLSGEPWDLGNLSTCEDTGGIYTGNVILETQEELNDFGAFNYQSINGNLTIGGNSSTSSNITDLTPLMALESITGVLSVLNTNITSLVGFSNLNSVGGTIFVQFNADLTSLEGFDSLQAIQNMAIRYNPLLNSLEGLEQITTINGFLRIENNTMLSSISQLSNLTSIASLSLNTNPSLVNLVGMNQLTSLGWLQIRNQDLLTDLSELSALIEVNYLFISDNDSLTSLNGLQNLLDITGLFIGIDIDTDVFHPYPNINLTDFCALTNLFVSGNYVVDGNSTTTLLDGVNIANNPFNPTVQNIIDGNCSQ